MKYPALLAVLLALSLSACGKKQEAQTPAPAPEAAAPAAPAAPAPEAAAPAPEAAAPAGTMAMTANAGEAKFKAVCANCHGAQGQGMGTFPKLAGLTAADIKTKLETYRKGENIGPMSATMIPQAKALSDKEIDDLSQYIATLK